MSKITNDCLTRSGTARFMATVGVKRLIDTSYYTQCLHVYSSKIKLTQIAITTIIRSQQP